MQSENTCQPSAESEAESVQQESSYPQEGTAGLAADRKQRRFQYMKEWYRKNRDRNRIKFRAWADANKDKRRASRRKHYWANREKVIAATRRYYKNNRAKVLASLKRYASNHIEEKRAYAKKYHPVHYQKNKQRLIAQTTAYRKAHPEVARRCAKNYTKKHPEKYRAYLSKMHAIRRHRVKHAKVNCPNVGRLIQRWRSKTKFRCYWCNRIFGIKRLNVDHIIPISKNGKHEASNICPSCPACNNRKRDHLQNEAKYRGQMLLL